MNKNKEQQTVPDRQVDRKNHSKEINIKCNLVAGVFFIPTTVPHIRVLSNVTFPRFCPFILRKDMVTLLKWWFITALTDALTDPPQKPISRLH